MANEISRIEAKALEEFDGYAELVGIMGEGRELGIEDVVRILKVPEVVAAGLMVSIAEAYIDIQKAIARVTYARKNYKRLQKVVDGSDDALAISASRELTDQLGMKKHAPLINQNLNVSIDQLIKKITRGDDE